MIEAWQYVAKLRELPVGKQQEVLDFTSFLGTKERPPLISLEGLWAGQGVDIAELRREMWGKFPRDIE